MVDLIKMSTEDLIDLKAACDKRLQAVREEARRTIWIVGGEHFNSGWFRDTDFLLALAHYQKVFAEDFPHWAQQCIEKKCGPQDLRTILPQIRAHRISENDYFNEWFPEDKKESE